MMNKTTTASIHILGPEEGDRSRLGGCQDRFMIDGGETDSRFALVEHRFDAHALASPMHRHRNEDEYTFIVQGRMGAILGEEEVYGGKGDLVFKPRNQWHTFWNADEAPLVVLEMISPAGLEQLFRSFGQLTEPPEGPELAEMAARYGCDLDFDRTFPLVERLGLSL